MILFEEPLNSANQVKLLVSRNSKRIVEWDIQKIFEVSLHEILGMHCLASDGADAVGSNNGKTEILQAFTNSFPATCELGDDSRAFNAAKNEIELLGIIEDSKMCLKGARFFIKRAFQDDALHLSDYGLNSGAKLQRAYEDG